MPALGTGLLLLIPWLLVMQLAVRVERRRAVAIHGIPVILPPRRRSRRAGTAGWLSNRWFELGTWAFWRGVLHHHLAILVAGAFFTLATPMLRRIPLSVAETILVLVGVSNPAVSCRKRIAAARALHGETPPAPLVRAVENLKLALRLRVARGDLTEDRIRELAATIDAAATAVERS